MAETITIEEIGQIEREVGDALNAPCLTFETLTERIKDPRAGLIPVPVRYAGPTKAPEFDGTLDEYLQTISACGARAVLIGRLKFNESRFIVESPFDQTKEKEIDIRTLDTIIEQAIQSNPANFKQFEQYLEQDAAFELTAQTDVGRLVFWHYQPWWDAFTELREEAKKSLESIAEAARAEEDSAKRERQTALQAKLNSLLNDQAFRSQKTQRGMRTYALETYPELADLDDAYLREQIAIMSDKVGLKKH